MLSPGWGDPPRAVVDAWANLAERFGRLVAKHPRLKNTNNLVHLGTLGTGNHFIELCLDEEQRVWIMLHSGSRGVGNAIGTFFIELAKQDMRKWYINLPDEDLAYFPEGTDHFDDYVEAVEWAQDFAKLNRRMMMAHVIDALRGQIAKPFEAELEAVNCHHNYVTRENHFGENVLVTRKGAVRAAKGVMGIIPGSMGAKSFIVRGLGNPESFDSCSHGAGRVMSRTEAKRVVTLDEHIADTAGVECRKDLGVIDESPRAYKPIEAVMAAQADLVEIVHTLKQVVCVKG
jgi:tRNA-splicing ligase RtcB